MHPAVGKSIQIATLITLNILQDIATRESFLKLKDEKLSLLVQEFEKELLTGLGFGVPDNHHQTGSLRDYIEEVIEKPINTPRIVRQLF